MIGAQLFYVSLDILILKENSDPRNITASASLAGKYPIFDER